MDNQRLFLFAGLGLTLMLLWQQWQIDYGSKPPQDNAEETDNRDAVAEEVPAAAADQASAGAAAAPTIPSDRSDKERIVTVLTDTLEVKLSTIGATIVGLKLKKYPVSIDDPDTYFSLLSDDPQQFYIAQSGLTSNASVAPTHLDAFDVELTDYRLDADQRQLRVDFFWRQEGIEVTKTYVFRADSYVIDVEYTVVNRSDKSWVGNQYRQLQRKGITDEGGGFFGVRSYIGGVISSPEDVYEKIDFDEFVEIENGVKIPTVNQKITGGWASIIQHYFLSAWIPDPSAENTYYTNAYPDRNRYVLGLYSQAKLVAVDGTERFSTTFYAGPKIQQDLAAVAPNLNLTVDYGFLSIVSEPLFRLLKWINEKVGNWGWSIIILTFIIKMVFYPLSHISYRSMAKMRKLQPKMQVLKERYGNDRAKMSQATMELYKKESVNPLGGCLPILIQIPVFIALYWVLLESVELRQAAFIGWIKDMAVRDPYFILPIIMGATMYIQQKLNPAPVDPVQAKVFMIMPFAFTLFFLFFPAGLVLYWVANNTLSIAQQYYITRHVLAEK